jgi:tetratricopeptide (TPR) repeat protein
MVAAALVIAGAIYFNRDSDENQVDGITQMLEQAEVAFVASRLISPKGNNALERYQHVLEQEPGNAKAKQGVANILQHYLKLAERSFESNQLNQAREHLTVAESIQPGNQSVTQFQLKLDERLKVGEKSRRITQSLEAAKLAFEQGNVFAPSGQSALDKYQAVIEMEPDNSEALQGINEVTDYLSRQVERSINEGNLSSAEADLQTAEKLSLQSNKLDQLREKLTTSHRENIRQQSITRMLEKAEKFYKLKQWTYPLGNNALEYYKEVLRLDPGNRDALHGQEKIVNYYLRRMDAKIKTGNLQSAESSLKKAESIQPKNPQVVEARIRWQQAKKSFESVSIPSSKISPLNGRWSNKICQSY